MSEKGISLSAFKAGLLKFAASIGPGIFIIGFIIGTGSVTTMVVAGAKYGMSMTWALALSCFFTYVMITSISRITIVSGDTLIYCIKQRFGRAAAIFIIIGLMVTVVASVIGITGIATDVLREWSKPFTPSGNGAHPIFSAILLGSILYYLFWHGKHGFFLRAMSVVVAMMGVSFIVSMFMVVPSVSEIVTGLVPQIPKEANANLILAGLVGTTMAGVCVVTRSYLVAEQKWTLKDLKVENRDASISLILTFIVSAAIMACSAGTMHAQGIVVENTVDMIRTLEPIAGRFASSIFVLGILAAALSSLFPSYVLGPWLTCDYLNIPRKMDRKLVRIAVLIVPLIGLIVPVFGGKPIVIMVASQAFSPVVMPLLIVFVYILLNNKKTVGEYKNPIVLNILLAVTFIFSLFISYSAVVGLVNFLKNI